MIALAIAASSIACNVTQASSPADEDASGSAATVNPSAASPNGVSASAVWVSGDLHVHAECGDERLTGAQLVAQMETAKIQVASSLVWGPDFATQHAAFTGKDDPSANAERILHPDLEVSGFAAGQAGHLVILGLSNIDFSADPVNGPRSGLPIADWAAAQGPRVVTGYSHAWAWPERGFPQAADEPDCCTPFELPINVMRGRASFLVEEANPENASSLGANLAFGPLSAGGFVLWRSMQNLGYRVAIGGGSDNGCLSDLMGKPRTLALVDGALTYDAYLDAIRKGRTILASDARDRVELVVNEARIGGEVTIDAPGAVTVELRGDLAAATDVDILVNGIATGRVPLAAGPSTAKVSVAVSQSSWITARTKRVQTSPVYVLVGTAPIRASADDACYMVRYVDHVKAIALKAGRPEQALYFGTERAATLAAYDEAKLEFEKRFREAGGTTCAGRE